MLIETKLLLLLSAWSKLIISSFVVEKLISCIFKVLVVQVPEPAKASHINSIKM